jgi:hypothetical protein
MARKMFLGSMVTGKFLEELGGEFVLLARRS